MDSSSNIYEKSKKLAENTDARKRMETREKEFAAKNPYVAGKQRTLDIYLGLSQNVEQWRFAFLSVLALLVVCVVLLCVMSTHSNRVVPYVVKVDSVGQVFPVGPAKKSEITNRIITSQIGQFIMNSRRRVFDRTSQIYFVRQAYRCIAENSEAYKKLNIYYRNNIPTNATAEVEVVLHSIVPISAEGYDVEWEERAGGGGDITITKYKGYFEVVVSPPDDMKHLISNPLGVFIKNFQIAEQI